MTIMILIQMNNIDREEDDYYEKESSLYGMMTWLSGPPPPLYMETSLF